MSRFPERDWVVKHADARVPLTPEQLKEYTEHCQTCDNPTRPKDRGQCNSCWTLEHLT